MFQHELWFKSGVGKNKALSSLVFNSVSGVGLGCFFLEVDSQTGTRDVLEKLRGPKDFKQQEEQFLLSLKVLLESLSVEAADQVTDQRWVSGIANEDSVSLIQHDGSQDGSDGQGCTKVECGNGSGFKEPL